MSEQNTKKKKGFSRRKFLVRSAVGVGVIMGTGYLTRNIWRRYLAGVANTAEAAYLGNTKNPSIWFEVTADNKVILYSPKVEMGQGTFTGLAQIAADELDVDINQMIVKHAATDSTNIDPFATGGSTSISSLWNPLRELAASMREMISAEAARQMNVDPSTIETKNGTVSAGGKSLTYGEVVAKATEWKAPKKPKLKNMSEYRYIGQPTPRIDLEAKVMGDPIFGIDAQLPGMLFGSVVRPDVIGATLQDVDISMAENMPGVIQIVQESDFVGVIAKTITEAEKAKRAIKAKWNTEKNWQISDIEEAIKVGNGKPITIQKQGNAKDILEDDPDVISAEYKSPIGAHAQLEPNGCLADVKDNEATIYMSTQVVKITRDEVADRIGIPKNNVTIQPTYLGGGFGRRLHTPNAMQAAVLSKAAGKPVKCYFDRKEEFQHDTFRPPTHHVLKAKLKENGTIEAMEHHVSSGDVMYGSPLLPKILQQTIGSDVGAWRGGMIQYGAIPNHRAVSWRVKLPFATSWWRSLGLLANTFAIESFMDELAVIAGKDPIQFRLDQIQDDDRGYRLSEVIKACRDRAGWKDEVVNGTAMGFACSTDANTPVAQIAEVSFNQNEIKVHKVTCVIDPGIAVNPDQVKAQCEGSIIMGMSASMFEKMTVKNNQLRPTIYGPYRMAMMRHAPKEIDTVILQNADAPGAVGEPPLGPIGAAIANAVFRLTGKRLREMPLSV